MVKIKKEANTKGATREMPIGDSAIISLRKTGYKPSI